MQYIWASRERHLILCTTSAVHHSPQAGFPLRTPAKTVKLGSRFLGFESPGRADSVDAESGAVPYERRPPAEQDSY